MLNSKDSITLERGGRGFWAHLSISTRQSPYAIYFNFNNGKYEDSSLSRGSLYSCKTHNMILSNLGGDRGKRGNINKQTIVKFNVIDERKGLFLDPLEVMSQGSSNNQTNFVPLFRLNHLHSGNNTMPGTRVGISLVKQPRGKFMMGDDWSKLMGRVRKPKLPLRSRHSH